MNDLTEPELAGRLDARLGAEAVHAVWLASGGRLGPALDLTADPALLDLGVDPVVHLALTVPTRAEFLQLDPGVIRLLEAAIQRPAPDVTRARLLARLARELLADPSAAARRRALIDDAVTLARADGRPGPIGEVLDHRLHALWDPAAADERLSTAAEIVACARSAGAGELERRGLFWRFIALTERGELDAAEAALTGYARAGELAGDAEAGVMVAARRAMLAIVRGRFEQAAALADEVGERGRQAGLADTDRLLGTLHGRLKMLRGESAGLAETLQELAVRLPGHFFEATAARALVEDGRTIEAGLELERLLPSVLAGSGPRWLGALADLSVAARSPEPAAAQLLSDALLPYQGRLVIWGGANTVTGPVDDYLGRLDLRLGNLDAAVGRLDRAIELEERIGALPWLADSLTTRARALSARADRDDHKRAESDRARARSIADRLDLKGLSADLEPPVNEWRLIRDGEDWRLEAGSENIRLRDGRGLHYLRMLLAAPGQEIAALDLAAGGAGLRVADGTPLLDDTARAAYRRRLQVLDEQLDAADRTGATDRAGAAQAERTALLQELRRAQGLGGRSRAANDEAERARVNVTRALWAAVERVESTAPRTGAHLRASLHTGRLVRYQPAPGGPRRWRV